MLLFWKTSSLYTHPMNLEPYTPYESIYPKFLKQEKLPWLVATTPFSLGQYWFWSTNWSIWGLNIMDSKLDWGLTRMINRSVAFGQCMRAIGRIWELINSSWFEIFTMGQSFYFLPKFFSSKNDFTAVLDQNRLVFAKLKVISKKKS